MSTHEDLNEYKPMAYIFLNKAIFHEKISTLQYCISRSSFFGPAPSAAVSADVLEEVEGTSLQIAVAISKRRGVHNEWAIAHLAWHCDLLEGAPMALEYLAWSLDRLMNQLRYSRTWLGSRLFEDQHGHLCAIGRAIDKAMSERGYAVTILLRWLLTPAARVGGALSPFTMGRENATFELGFTVRASSFDHYSHPFITGVVVCSHSTHHNRRGGTRGDTPCCHDSRLLGPTNLAPSPVHPTATDAFQSILSWNIGVRRVGSGRSATTANPDRHIFRPKGPPS